MALICVYPVLFHFAMSIPPRLRGGSAIYCSRWQPLQVLISKLDHTTHLRTFISCVLNSNVCTAIIDYLWCMKVTCMENVPNTCISGFHTGFLVGGRNDGQRASKIGGCGVPPRKVFFCLRCNLKVFVPQTIGLVPVFLGKFWESDGQ